MGNIYAEHLAIVPELTQKLNLYPLSRSDTKVQDRSLVPHDLKDQLATVAAEIGAISEKLGRLHKNGQLIVERTHNYAERDLVQSSCTTLTDQLDQLQTLLQRRKVAVRLSFVGWLML